MQPADFQAHFDDILSERGEAASYRRASGGPDIDITVIRGGRMVEKYNDEGLSVRSRGDGFLLKQSDLDQGGLFEPVRDDKVLFAGKEFTLFPEGDNPVAEDIGNYGYAWRLHTKQTG